MYRRTGFSGLDGSVQVHGDGQPTVESVMVTTAIPEGKPRYPAASLFTYGKPLTNLGENISRSLHGLTGLQAPVENLLEADLKDKYGIVLAMDKSLLFKLDETGFSQMQILFSTARGILWVSRGARSRKPEAK